MGLFDKPQESADGSLRELIGVPIHILRIKQREVDTMYGPGTALDVYILAPDGKGGTTEKWYSGFSAGIKRQVNDAAEGDFPVWAKIEEKSLRGGRSTLVLVPSSEDEAAQLSTDDDIPF